MTNNFLLREAKGIALSANADLKKTQTQTLIPCLTCQHRDYLPWNNINITLETDEINDITSIGVF